MFKWLTSLFTRKIEYIITDHYIFGYKKGTLDLINRDRLLKGKLFEFNGSPSDFIMIPKHQGGN